MTNPFDARAKTWDENPGRVKLAADLFAALERRIPLRPEWTVLEYGAGTGLLTLALAPRVRRVTAVDSSAGMLEILEAKSRAGGIANVVRLQADFATGPRPPGPYDLLISAMTLHHIADVDNLLRVFFELLGPGGWLALADLDAEDGTFHADPTGVHHAGFNRRTLTQQLEQVGFEDIHVETGATIHRPARGYPVFLAMARRMMN